MSKIICDIRFIKSWSYCGTNVITTRIISTDTGSFNKAPDSKKAIIKDAKAMAEAIQKESSRKKPKKYDVVIVGGGIVGVATARELSNRSCNLKMAILEKEKQLAGHQSGRNSGVIHAGIYYVPGSLKAKLCTEGMRMAYDYLDCKKIPYKKCGKLIIATNPYEVCLLDKLEKRGKLNNVPGLKRLKCLAEIQKIEPLAQGLEALWSPETGIVDWGLVTKYLAEDFKTRNGQVHLGFEVNNFCESNDAEYPVKITSVCGEEVQSKFVLTCGGLYSDRLAVMSGCSPDPKIIPFRGEYYTLKPAKACKFQKNIYPVPDPSYPFLGLHVTPRVDGNVWLGPNAILAFKREGYSFKDYSMKEIMETVFYPGFIRFSLRYLIPGVRELYRSQNIQRQLKQLQKMVPSITLADIETPNPTEPVSGVRAQAMDSKGNLIDDFVFDINKTGGTPISCRILHCRNAPSPGATSSMAIGKHIAEMFEKEFGELHEIEKDRQRKVDEELRATQARMVQKPNP